MRVHVHWDIEPYVCCFVCLRVCACVFVPLVGAFARLYLCAYLGHCACVCCCGGGGRGLAGHRKVQLHKALQTFSTDIQRASM